MDYNRQIYIKIQEMLFCEQVLIIYGPRQVGKTTLSKKILTDNQNIQTKYINCESLAVRELLSKETPSELKAFIGEAKLIVLDEAQQIENIGLKLKLLIDNYPELQIIATGSSSFDLANKVNEPLTGRKKTFYLYPLAQNEVKNRIGLESFTANYENFIRFGFYPRVVNLLLEKGEEAARDELSELASSYLYKDVLEFNNIRKSSVLDDLLRALALQIGNEVSFTELSQLLKVDQETVRNYIDILEKTFVIFKLRSFSRNLRKEISKRYKVYFWDLGIRNSLLQNFNPLELRSDKGALWENFVISEKIKANNNQRIFANYYFWRTYDQQEIDLIEERDGKLMGYEIKYELKASKFRAPKVFLNEYEGATVELITKENF